MNEEMNRFAWIPPHTTILLTNHHVTVIIFITGSMAPKTTQNLTLNTTQNQNVVLLSLGQNMSAWHKHEKVRTSNIYVTKYKCK